VKGKQSRAIGDDGIGNLVLVKDGSSSGRPMDYGDISLPAVICIDGCLRLLMFSKRNSRLLPGVKSDKSERGYGSLGTNQILPVQFHVLISGSGDVDAESDRTTQLDSPVLE
jgi:hypothetical protein